MSRQLLDQLHPDAAGPLALAGAEAIDHLAARPVAPPADRAFPDPPHRVLACSWSFDGSTPYTSRLNGVGEPTPAYHFFADSPSGASAIRRTSALMPSPVRICTGRRPFG